nr:MAG TPA: hypothetical protein [Caudoviricetes sp.]
MLDGFRRLHVDFFRDQQHTSVYYTRCPEKSTGKPKNIA